MYDTVEALFSGILESGSWGTIGHNSIDGADALRAATGAAHGVVCHSETAAYEAVLRAFGCAYGDRVVMPEYCAPFDALVLVCVGAAPLFCGVEGENGVISPDALDNTLAGQNAGNIRAVCCDICPDCGLELERLSAICALHSLPLILLAHGAVSLRYRGEPLTKLAGTGAVVYSLGEDSELNCVQGGFAASDSEDIFAKIFAYHNCGRGFGEGCTLDCDRLIGGDLRVTEWNAALIRKRLASPRRAVAPERRIMRDEPVFKSEYFRKATGATDFYGEI